ncbi:exocyst complex component EXO70A1-like [Solanum tuberosum]|uniref:Exocyst subunit Exo70 family protein n=1 Tax=Solanum tuberosum TaxID=4113 RepID=M1CZG7_SOLTU|nr:PREDICTED: exocyst complex component EXO70A1-like [Solanum tuberosum]
MTGFFSLSKHSSPLHASSQSTHHKFSDTLMEDTLKNAEEIIKRWDLDESSSNLFQDNRTEAKQFLDAVIDLQHAMQFVVKESSTSQLLVRAQNLMKIAMKRLQKEFYTILAGNRYFLDSESGSRESTRYSGSDEDQGSEDDNAEIEARFAEISITDEGEKVSVAVDLKAIADCMIEAGYGKECSKIYELNRKSVIEETLYYLGVENICPSTVQKMDWKDLEKKIKIWLNAVKVAVSTLFYGERILCDQVFSISDSIRESCFTGIAKDSALTLFTFPEMVAKYKKLSLEKMFRILDLYDSISELLSEIEVIFGFDSTVAVKSQALTSMAKLRDAARAMLAEFESAIKKDSSKVVAGGGIHPLTRYVMNYLIFLSDYSGPVSDIIADWKAVVKSPLPESYLLSPIADDGESPSCIVSVRLTWLILVLLCKLDGKAGFYGDVPLSYLFLANNLNYVVSKVRQSSLKLLLGPDWLSNHESKVEQYMANFKRMGWSSVMTSLPENSTAEISPAEAKECFCKFSLSFEETYWKQRSWVIPDPKLRDEVKISLAKKILSAYRPFYHKYGEKVAWMESGGGVESILRFAPDNVQNYLSDLFHGSSENSSTTSSSHGSSSRSTPTWSSPPQGR